MSEAASNSVSPPAAHPVSSTALIAALGIIAMLSGLLVVLTYQLTLPRIKANQQRAIEQAIFSVLPEASQRRNLFVDASGLQVDVDTAMANIFAGYNAEGQLTGLAMEGAARGYQDVVRILYGYSLESQCVIGITVLQSNETPGLGDKVESDPAFLANFECLDASMRPDGAAVANPIHTVKNGKKEHPWQIDGISGATVTSTAIGDGLQSSTDRLLPLIHRFKAQIPLTFDQK